MSNTIQGVHYATKEHISIGVKNGIISDIETSENSDSNDYIAPGLVDLQINGFKGVDFNTPPISKSQVQEVTKKLWAEGVTSFYPTIITNSDDAIEDMVSAIAKACEHDPFVDSCIPGIHIEGPFISPEDGPRGAHGKEYVKEPCWELFQKWQKAAKGRIKLITISPEWENANEFISKCVENGVVVSIGHTSASSDQIRAAVEAGATMSTHLGNGAHLELPRHPNYIWEQLAQEKLFTCLICDGFHLPDSFLKVAIRAKRSKAMMVSDAVFLSGMEPGTYETHIGGEVTLTSKDKLHLSGNPRMLAGSVQMLRHGISNLIKKNITSMPEAFDMAAKRPASFMDISTKKGIEIGAPADLIKFDLAKDEVNIRKTYKNGSLVYSSR